MKQDCLILIFITCKRLEKKSLSKISLLLLADISMHWREGNRDKGPWEIDLGAARTPKFHIFYLLLFY